MNFFKSLFFQIIVAVVIGIGVGIAFPDFGEQLQPLGTGFIKLIKMLIAPLIFFVVVAGIAKAGDLKAVGRIGLKAILWFELATTVALMLGLVAARVLRPGDGMNINASTLDPNAVAAKTGGAELPHTVDFILNIIPTSAVDAFAQNALLQVLLLACLFGTALAASESKLKDNVLTLVDQIMELIFKVVGYIMKLAPLGAFGAIAYTVGAYGAATLASYGMLIIACYLSAILFLVCLGLAAWWITGMNLLQFIKYTRSEIMLAIGTASSEVVMPRMMEKLNKAGCDKAVVGLVVPTGYSFNLDGASIYLSLATVFLAQAVGIDLSLGQEITILAVLMLSSKGMAGVPGSAFLALSATAAALNAFPVAVVALLLGADRFMDTMRVFTNLMGNCVAAFVVAKWEGMLDTKKMKAVLSGEWTEEESEQIATTKHTKSPETIPSPLGHPLAQSYTVYDKT
ncbi:aerobic C4-dicarboxylate transport protein [Paenibacillus sp. SORGH_AS306]|uniref:C4-dicarboxylate transporter DctA n=1 Tax=unclassified Paenibacillus TaxID=185978 RepID=UPI00277F2033|nr:MULTISPECIES: C4-dicarboxylate transporter DctA [unclassified Paenibacillus]MDQ1235222.1 aerobic C4-dicarboxylate transport protein [Paenibacillus sp. SORGH_AS_0306]MDR6112269.1 aerobic C4-dicarboxylate transport protein [Paenibacillus sp. SORGH_AS_0338]